MYLELIPIRIGRFRIGKPLMSIPIRILIRFHNTQFTTRNSTCRHLLVLHMAVFATNSRVVLSIYDWKF